MLQSSTLEFKVHNQTNCMSSAELDQQHKHKYYSEMLAGLASDEAFSVATNLREEELLVLLDTAPTLENLITEDTEGKNLLSLRLIVC